jgi:hypothetical protein
VAPAHADTADTADPTHTDTADTTRRYVPLAELRDRPHVIVDGAARPGTVLCLSHWPHTPTPPPVRADLSTEVVLLALEEGLLDAAPALVTVDHYDEDAMASLALLVHDGLADRHAQLLVEVARVGDFGVVRQRRAALVAFALGALIDPRRTPVPALAGATAAGRPDVTAEASRHALAIVPRLLDDHGPFAPLWADEAAAFDASRAALEAGWARLEEVEDVDLAVLRVDVGHPDATRARWAGRVLHPAAVHSATERLRVATVAAGRAEVRYRYESWVRLARPPRRLRVDLSGVAAELSAEEDGAARWSFDGAGAITAALHPQGEERSSLDPEFVVDLVVRRLAELDRGPAAWDPYAASGV